MKKRTFKQNLMKSLMISTSVLTLSSAVTPLSVLAQEKDEAPDTSVSTSESTVKESITGETEASTENSSISQPENTTFFSDSTAPKPAKVNDEEVVNKVAVQITLDNYVVGTSTTITGSYDGTNATYMRAEVNGVKQALIPSKDLATGNISYYIGKGLKTTDTVQLVLFDKDYKEIGRQNVPMSITQKITLRGVGTEYAQIGPMYLNYQDKIYITTIDQKINIVTPSPDSGYLIPVHEHYGTDIFMSMDVIGPNGEKLFSKAYKGIDRIPLATTLFSGDLKNGGRLVIYNADKWRVITDNLSLPSSTEASIKVTYEMRDNRLVQIPNA